MRVRVRVRERERAKAEARAQGVHLRKIGVLGVGVDETVEYGAPHGESLPLERGLLRLGLGLGRGRGRG